MSSKRIIITIDNKTLEKLDKIPKEHKKAFSTRTKATNIAFELMLPHLNKLLSNLGNINDLYTGIKEALTLTDSKIKYEVKQDQYPFIRKYLIEFKLIWKNLSISFPTIFKKEIDNIYSLNENLIINFKKKD